MSDKIELVGGPRDGQFVPDYGPEFREPARHEVRIYPVVSAEIAHLDFPSFHDPSLRVLRYQKRIDARDHRPRYVYVP